MSENRVVVGIDGSTSSRSALIWAAHEAHLREVDLLVVHARFRPAYDVLFAGGFYLPPIADEGEEVAEILRVATGLVEHVAPDLEVKVSARPGPAALALLEAATEGAGCVVVGSRGLGAFGSLFLGSVSIHVAARSPVPVVVVPTDTTFSTTGPVVVGVDGSPHAQAAVHAAAEEAARRHVPLDIVAAYTVPTDLLVTPLATSRDEFRQAFQIQAQANAETAAHAAGDARTVRTHVAEGPPAREIARIAETASLVVVGSRGHGEITGPVLGSVSQTLLRHATWPVLVVHHTSTD